MKNNIQFLDVNQIIAIHNTLLTQHGGATGLRDRGLLESATHQAQMGFD